MPEPRKFASKQEVTEYLRDRILDGVRPDLADSLLEISVRDSPKTNSKYIYLYYPDRSDNPDNERVPYTVRISDHDQTYLFRRNRPNAFLQIVPCLSEQTQRLRERKIQLYEHLSVSVQVDRQAREQLLLLRNRVAQNLQQDQAKFRYTYHGDPEAIILRMRSIAQYQTVKEPISETPAWLSEALSPPPSVS